MMRRTIAVCLLFAIAGCGRSPQAATDELAAPAAPTDSGEVRFQPESPQLKRLRVEEVRSEQVPLEEVVAPGKIEANPTHVSRVALPLPGRVKQVMVTIGDAVSQGQPVIALDSPDV